MNLPEELSLESLQEAVIERKKDISFDSLDSMIDLPYYDAQQMIDMGVFNALGSSNYFNTPSSNILIGENLSASDWFKEYSILCKNGTITDRYKELHTLRNKTLSKLCNEYKLATENGIGDLDSLKQSILELGHNPEVPFNSITRGKINEFRKAELEENLKPISLEEKFKISFNDDSILIDNIDKIDYNMEYTKSSKLLRAYNNVKNISGIKYELAKLWFFNYTIESKLYKKKNIKDKDDLLKTKDKILELFVKYLEIVCKHEQGFNFTEFFNNTEFATATHKINRSLLKLGLKLLRLII